MHHYVIGHFVQFLFCFFLSKFSKFDVSAQRIGAFDSPVRPTRPDVPLPPYTPDYLSLRFACGAFACGALKAPRKKPIIAGVKDFLLGRGGSVVTSENTTSRHPPEKSLLEGPLACVFGGT